MMTPSKSFSLIYLKHLCIFVPMYLNLRFSIQMGFHFGTITSLGWLRRLKNKWDLPPQRATGDDFLCTFINWCILSSIVPSLFFQKHMNNFCCKVRKGNHCWDHGQVSELQIPYSWFVNGFIPLELSSDSRALWLRNLLKNIDQYRNAKWCRV